MSHRKRKSDDDVEWRKKKTKCKSKDVESVVFFYHSFTNSIRSWQCYQFGRCKRYTLEKIGEFT